MLEVPFVDLKRQHAYLREDIRRAIDNICEQSDFVLGKAVAEFETLFATFCGARYCVAVNSGTSALIIALRAMGIGPGDEVVVPSHTFFATAAAVVCVGATPIFVDIGENSYALDLADAEKKITKNTKAIIPVHLYGQIVPMAPVMHFARQHNLQVLEDACQAHGATQNGKAPGSWGIAVFSFYPGKNLGAYGEGGAIVTNDEKIVELARALRDHGSYKKYVHTMIGYNMRMEGIQGAVLNVKMQHLTHWNELRNQHAAYYREHLRGVGDITTEAIEPGNFSSFHLFVIQTMHRDNLQAFLKQRGVNTGIHYPIPIHRQEAVRKNGCKRGDLPRTEAVCERILSLPMFPELIREELDYVIQNIKMFYEVTR